MEGINVPSGGHLRLKAYAKLAKYNCRGRNKEKSLVGQDTLQKGGIWCALPVKLDMGSIRLDSSGYCNEYILGVQDH